jgi:hypothetical protein
VPAEGGFVLRSYGGFFNEDVIPYRSPPAVATNFTDKVADDARRWPARELSVSHSSSG